MGLSRRQGNRMVSNRLRSDIFRIHLLNLDLEAESRALSYLEHTRKRFPGNHIIECMYADLVRAGYAQGFSGEKNPIDLVFDIVSRIHATHDDCPVCTLAV